MTNFQIDFFGANKYYRTIASINAIDFISRSLFSIDIMIATEIITVERNGPIR